MKIANLIVALFFVFGICAGSFVDAGAASSDSAKTEKSSRKSTKKEKKGGKKAGKKSEKKADTAGKKTGKNADKKKSGKKSKKKSDKKVEKKAEKKGAKKSAKTAVKKPLPAAKSISINRASKEELMALPGVGPVIADAIISHRKGSKFKSIDDLKEVKGIGDKTFADLKKYIKP